MIDACGSFNCTAKLTEIILWFNQCAACWPGASNNLIINEQIPIFWIQSACLRLWHMELNSGSNNFLAGSFIWENNIFGTFVRRRPQQCEDLNRWRNPNLDWQLKFRLLQLKLNTTKLDCLNYSLMWNFRRRRPQPHPPLFAELAIHLEVHEPHY